MAFRNVGMIVTLCFEHIKGTIFDCYKCLLLLDGALMTDWVVHVVE